MSSNVSRMPASRNVSSRVPDTMSNTVLSPFARHGLSMNRIESRPAHSGRWQYAFFVDVEGHVEDEATRHALDELAEVAPDVRVLGSYPVAIA